MLRGLLDNNYCCRFVYFELLAAKYSADSAVQSRQGYQIAGP